MTEFVEWLSETHKRACGVRYKFTVTQTPATRVTCERGTVMDHPANKSLLAYERIPAEK
jgi:hypothetical protein